MHPYRWRRGRCRAILNVTLNPQEERKRKQWTGFADDISCSKATGWGGRTDRQLKQQREHRSVMSTFGRYFRVSTFGESHCAAVGAVVSISQSGKRGSVCFCCSSRFFSFLFPLLFFVPFSVFSSEYVAEKGFRWTECLRGCLSTKGISSVS